MKNNDNSNNRGYYPDSSILPLLRGLAVVIFRLVFYSMALFLLVIILLNVLIWLLGS